MTVRPRSNKGKPIMSMDEAVNKNDPKPGGHDKKFQKWSLSRPTGTGNATENKTVEVFAHPEGGQRARRIVGFVTHYDGVGFYDTDGWIAWALIAGEVEYEDMFSLGFFACENEPGGFFADAPYKKYKAGKTLIKQRCGFDY